jgi:hypothetical protein
MHCVVYTVPRRAFESLEGRIRRELGIHNEGLHSLFSLPNVEMDRSCKTGGRSGKSIQKFIAKPDDAPWDT